jgi:hypothetical protein
MGISAVTSIAHGLRMAGGRRSWGKGCDFEDIDRLLPPMFIVNVYHATKSILSSSSR